MKIITCASYYTTGSSAVTDFCSEFSCCSSVGDHEFRFIYDPDGIRDLEFHLIENNNRHNTSNAIKRYLNFAKQFNGGWIRRGYQKYMGKHFMEYTLEYIDKITELKCESWWYYDSIEKGYLFYCADALIYNFFLKVFHRRGVSLLNLTHEKGYYSAIGKDYFYQCTKEYIQKVIESMNYHNSEYVMVDQLLPPSNIDDYLNYFDKDKIRVVVVDRDPRDIFIFANELYHEKVVPYNNVKEFCEWYEIIRRHRKTEEYNKNCVYLLQFEDLIYQYEETTRKLMDFIGLKEEDHVAPKKFFNPTISIRNTNQKDQYPQYKKDIIYIEEHLKEYLYHFQ